MRARLSLITTSICLSTVAVAGVAQAAPATGTSRFSLEGKGASSLRAQGVKLTATKPVRASSRSLVLPSSSGMLGSSVRLDSRGTLTLRKGKRRMVLKSLRATLGKRGSVSGVVGRKRIALLSVTPARRKAMRVNAATGRVTLQSAKVAITRSAGRSIKRALRLRRTPAGAFGTVTVTSVVRRSTTGAGTTPTGGKGVPVAGPIPGAEPPVLARPASAVDVTGSSISWRPRESYVEYMNTQTAPTASGGATLGPAEDKGKGALVYSFGYAPINGWWDPPTGTAALYFSGTVNFSFANHGIDNDTKNPEIEINGPASRAIFRLDGRGSTPYGNKRGVLLDLEPGTTANRCTRNANAFSCTIPAKVPADASQSIFAGFYRAGDPFGSVTVNFTTP